MEVVGGVASIITLLEATGVLAEVSKNLITKWHNAPQEIQALAARLSQIAAELQCIRDATFNGHSMLADAFVRQSLSDLLTEARNRLQKLESLHFRLLQHGNVRQKAQWALKDSKSAEKTLLKLADVERRLAQWMALISMRRQTDMINGIERIEQMVTALVFATPSNHTQLQLPPSTSSSTNNSITPLNRQPKTIAQLILAANHWMLNDSWESWGLRGSIFKTTRASYTDYTVGFTVPLPLARILGSYALTGSVSIRSCPLVGNLFTFRHPSYFAVARVLEYDHPFLQACIYGDLAVVQAMLQGGEGRPTDIDKDGDGPLRYAIAQGNVDVVTCLLDSGMDINQSISSKDLTPLEMAVRYRHLGIVRVLLQRGASQDHINLFSGYNATQMCWIIPDCVSSQQRTCTDLYNVLNEFAVQDLNVLGGQGVRSIHLAAAFGGALEIQELERLGCALKLDTDPTIDAMQVAVLHGNFATFQALCEQGNWFDRPDEELPDLLHIAIHGRHNSPWHGPDFQGIIEILLSSGVDPTSLASVENYEGAPDSVTGQNVTTFELAAAYGPETEAWYLSLLRRGGYLEDEEHFLRLRHLESMGYSARGYVVDESDSESFSDSGSEPNEVDMNERFEEASDKGDTDGAVPEQPGHCTNHDSDGNDDDDECFWDAAETQVA